MAEYLKDISEDKACHPTKSNGVSGHAFYATWALCQAWFLVELLKRKLTEFDAMPWLRSEVKRLPWNENWGIERT